MFIECSAIVNIHLPDFLQEMTDYWSVTTQRLVNIKSKSRNTIHVIPFIS